MYEKHSGEYIAKLTTAVLDLPYVDKQTKGVGVASDMRNVIDASKGWQTRTQASCLEQCKSVLYQAWCANHQIDLVHTVNVAAMGAASALEVIPDWFQSLRKVSIFLREQFNFAESMGGKSPFHSNVCSGSLGNIIRWYAKHRFTLAGFLG